MRKILGAGLVTALAVALVAIVDAHAHPALRFGACPPDLTAMSPQLTCASFEAPLDHADPDSGPVVLLAAELPARDPVRRRGVLFVNPGGPGESAAARLATLSQPDPSGATRLPPEVLDAYDLIGMDPRGVAHSSPVSCVAPQFWQGPAPDPDDPAARDRLWRHWADLAAGCGANAGPLLSHMGTVDVAKDMDLLRDRLGEPVISFFGSSYGTYLGAVYGQLFPQRVDRMVLDGLIDPVPEAMGFEAGFTQHPPLGARLHQWAEWTAVHDATFHLGATAAQVRAALDTTLARFRAAPHGSVGVSEVLGAVYDAMFSETRWGRLASAVADVAVRDDDRALVDAATVPVGPEMERSAAAATIVTCSDSVWPHDRAAYERAALAASTESPFAWWNMWIGGAACASWPVPHGSRMPITGAGLPRILMFNSVGDPATPYPGALALHRAIPGSVLVTEAGSGKHTVFANPQAVTNTAAQQLGAAYLVRGELPAGDLTIPGHPLPRP